jgi:uncharacterized protein (TIGR02246 family)
VDKDNQKLPSRSGLRSDPPAGNPEMDELYRQLQSDLSSPKPGPDAIAAALEAAQRLAAEADAEQAADDAAQDLIGSSPTVCKACGYCNRKGYKFCGRCGVSVLENESREAESVTSAEQPRRPRSIALHPNPFLDPEPEPEPESNSETRLESRPATSRSAGHETHHYHHHYHHHYFPGGQDGMAPRSASDPVRSDPARDSLRDSAREDKFRPTAALRGDMSRAEAAVRRITQEWVLACNTKHLDDLVDLYTADALVLRSNLPPVRGAAAIREFFFGALDSGLGEVEVDPLRVEVAGDLAYEAGRCKALVPSASGKRREERGKYLWVCARQSTGEWKLAADCWSSDLTLTTLESDVPQSAGVRTGQPRKNP